MLLGGTYDRQMQTREGSKHAEDGCTASDIQDDLVLEQMLVLADGILIASRSNFILLNV